jgi:hypothetical protein
MTIEELCSHLLTHEMRLEHNSSPTEPLFPSANLASARNFSNKQRTSYRGQHQNTGSSRRQHFRFNSFRGSSTHGRGSSHSSSGPSSCPFCQVCNKPGHTALTCHHRFDYSFQQDNSSNMQAFATSTYPTPPDATWFPDTGATNHVTADLANLNIQSDSYTGNDQLHIGNGQGLPIIHTGSSHLHYPNATFLLKNLLHVPQIKKKFSSLSLNLHVTIMFILSFTLLIFVLRISSWVIPYFAA